jgi:hypothetical protein
MRLSPARLPRYLAVKWFSCSKAPHSWSASTFALYSDNYQQTSFAGFMLDNAMSPTVAFYASQSSSAPGPRIPYDVVLVDTFGAWNASSYEFVVPVAGTYVVSVMFGIVNATANGNLLVNNSATSPLYGYKYAAASQQDFISTTFVICLNTNDRLSVAKTVWWRWCSHFCFHQLSQRIHGLSLLAHTRSVDSLVCGQSQLRSINRSPKPCHIHCRLCQRGFSVERDVKHGDSGTDGRLLCECERSDAVLSAHARGSGRERSGRGQCAAGDTSSSSVRL